jgi:hypothetical protein
MLSMFQVISGGGRYVMKCCGYLMLLLEGCELVEMSVFEGDVSMRCEFYLLLDDVLFELNSDR